MRIVIACPTLVEGDAVGNDIIEQYKCLKEEGIDVYIYAENYDGDISNLITKKSVDFLKDKDTILIYHHAIYWEKGIELLSNVKCKRVIKYHNITPENFFLPYSFDYFKICLLGRKQNHEMLNTCIDMLLSDSSFNAKDFLDIGFSEDRVRVLPPFNRIHEMENIRADVNILNKLSDGKINIFFVGRMSPNKGHRHILYTAYYFKLFFGNNIRFCIAGGLDPLLNGYYKELTGLVNHLGIGKIIKFVGRATPHQLKSYYLSSHVFLLLSEHEGFCIPILESQFFKLPLIAYATSAVRDTIGENQLTYENLNYEILASSIYTLHKDVEARGYLADEGYKNFLNYERDNLKNKFISFLKEIA